LRGSDLGFSLVGKVHQKLASSSSALRFESITLR